MGKTPARSDTGMVLAAGVPIALDHGEKRDEGGFWVGRVPQPGLGALRTGKPKDAALVSIKDAARSARSRRLPVPEEYFTARLVAV